MLIATLFVAINIIIDTKDTLFVDSRNHHALLKTKEIPAAQIWYSSLRPNTRVPGDNGYKDFVFQMTIMDMQV